MQLRSQQEIDAAMQKSYGKVTVERKREILATVQSTRPENKDATDAIFSEALTPDELAFYHDIVTGSASQKETAPAPDHMKVE
jgi:hypothetical protein